MYVEKLCTGVYKIINIPVETVENYNFINKIGKSYPQVLVETGNNLFPGKCNPVDYSQ